MCFKSLPLEPAQRKNKGTNWRRPRKGPATRLREQKRGLFGNGRVAGWFDTRIESDSDTSGKVFVVGGQGHFLVSHNSEIFKILVPEITELLFCSFLRMLRGVVARWWRGRRRPTTISYFPETSTSSSFSSRSGGGSQHRETLFGDVEARVCCSRFVLARGAGRATSRRHPHMESPCRNDLADIGQI